LAFIFTVPGYSLVKSQTKHSAAQILAGSTVITACISVLVLEGEKFEDFT